MLVGTRRGRRAGARRLGAVSQPGQWTLHCSGLLPGYQVGERTRLYAGYQPAACEGIYVGTWQAISSNFAGHPGFRGKGFGVQGVVTIQDEAEARSWLWSHRHQTAARSAVVFFP